MTVSSQTSAPSKPGLSFNIVSRLLILNGIAVAWAVMHHATHWVLMGMFYWTDRYRQVAVPNFDWLGSPQYNLLRLLDQFSAAGVPAFLFVSGYFIAFASGRGTKPVSWRMIFLRLRDLLIPYLLWCCVYLALDVVTGKSITPLEALRLIATGRIAPPFYYIILLAQLYLLAPLLIPRLRRRWKIILAGSALIQLPGVVANHLFQIEGATAVPAAFRVIFVDWTVPTYIFWFLLGAVAGIYLTEFKTFLGRNRRWLLPAALAAAALSMVEWEWLRQAGGREWLSPQEMLFNRFFALFVILGFFTLTNLEKRLPLWITTLGARSFGVYLIHSLVLEVTARAVYHFAPALLGMPLAFLALLWIAGLAAPYFMIELLERAPMRRYVKLLTGG